MSVDSAATRSVSRCAAAGSKTRAAAARAIAEVLGRGRSLATILPRHLDNLTDPRDRALMQELVYGVMRWLPRLEFVLARLTRRPPRTRDAEVAALLLIGIYQLAHLRIPEHAAVSATVEASRTLDRPWAASLVNAVLRGYLSRRAEVEDCTTNEAAHWAHPDWLLADIKRSWPAQWEAIAGAGNTHPPMTLRVNAQHHTRERYLALLESVGIAARAAPICRYGITLRYPVDLSRLPGFPNGWVSVQDAGAQLAAELLDVRSDQRVLDACAAPGGKTGHIIELYPGLAKLVALDRDPQRFSTLQDTLRRLGLRAELRCADCAATTEWWDGQPFDRILLDTPCSGTGVLRRHPDIKALRRASDIAAMARQQRQLLSDLWQVLAEGGTLLYVTCSILPEENQCVIEAFLDTHPEARLLPIEIAGGLDTGFGTQILPGSYDMDGFFYAQLAKGIGRAEYH